MTTNRLKRPAPEVLGADGLPIVEGETVWDVYGRGPAEVYRIGPADDEDGPVVWDIEGNYTMPYLLTHEPPVLGADGKPIVKGETAYRTDRPTAEINILYIRSYDDGSSDVVYCEGDPSSTKMCDSSLITHTPHDTQERIDRDARKGYMTYWECVGCSCERCPAMIDGDKPWRWYHADSCEGAMVLDLLRRQRELDKRTGGAE